MEYRNLGAAGVRVSALCLGAMTFGEADEQSFMHQVSCDEETAMAIMNRALDLGINFIDTADIYGQNGLSERVMGTWFDRDKRRDDVILATKFRFPMGSTPNTRGASRYWIMKAVEDSLRRLKTDRIDLYQVHMQDVDVAEEETLRSLSDLVRQGKVLHIGCSNYAAYRLADSLWTSRTRNLEKFITLQAQYNLIVRNLEREHIPLCRTHNVGLLTWAPLAAGFLTGKYQRDQPPASGTRLHKRTDRLELYGTERGWNILGEVVDIATEIEATPAQVSLAWLLHQEVVTSVIFGARSVQQLNDNVAAAAIKLDSYHLARLTKASAFDLGHPYDLLRRVQNRW